MPTGIASPYDNNQPLPGTQQTGNQSTTPAPTVNTSSTVGNIPLTVAPTATPTPATTPAPTPAPTQQPAGMPQPVQNTQAPGSIAPLPESQQNQQAGSFTATPTVTGVGPATQGVAKEATVAGQMDTLLKSDSPYMQQARDYALRDMNARGLANSTLAIGASQEAAIKQALPIAQQDAQAHLQQAQDNLNWINKFSSDQNQYLQDLDKLGANIRGNYAAEVSRISDALSADMRRNYLDQQVDMRKRLMDSYDAIQQNEKLSADQKSAASADMVSWFNTMNGWMNNSYAELSANEIDMNVFRGMNTASGAAENQLQTPASLAEQATKEKEKQAAEAEVAARLKKEGKLSGNPITDATIISDEINRIFAPDFIAKGTEQLNQDIRHGVREANNQIKEIFGW